jgi:hypothetical protein
MLGKAARDVALGDDAVHGRAAFADNRGADMFGSQTLRQMLDTEVGANGGDRVAFGLEDVGYVHGVCPWAWEARTAVARLMRPQTRQPRDRPG